MGLAESFVRKLMAKADVVVDGDRPWDVAVHDRSAYKRILVDGSLGLGESYMEGLWDTPNLDQLVAKIHGTRTNHQLAIPNLLSSLISAFSNQQSKLRSRRVGELHYDISTAFYEKMLDKRMIYTCAYWKDADNLDQAQENKLDLVCRKLRLQPGMKVLDLGCGWGGLARFMAENYGCEVEAITISREQARYGQEKCAGLPVTVRCDDYRHATGKFDRVVSVGLMEHVGRKNYAHFFDLAKQLVDPDGLVLFHTIGRTRINSTGDQWFDRYIFPGGELPALPELGNAFAGKFVMEDWHNIGAHYDWTLMAWYDNFKRHWPEFRDQYPDNFYRMWEYYLLASAGAFRARYHQLWQVVLSPNGVPGGYDSVR